MSSYYKQRILSSMRESVSQQNRITEEDQQDEQDEQDRRYQQYQEYHNNASNRVVGNSGASDTLQNIELPSSTLGGITNFIKEYNYPPNTVVNTALSNPRVHSLVGAVNKVADTHSRNVAVQSSNVMPRRAQPLTPPPAPSQPPLHPLPIHPPPPIHQPPPIPHPPPLIYTSSQSQSQQPSAQPPMISPLSPQVNAGEYGGTIQQLSQQLSQQPPQPPTRSLPGIVNRSKSTQPGIPANMAIEWNEALEQLLITWAE